jgi:hypothetical protein
MKKKMILKVVLKFQLNVALCKHPKIWLINAIEASIYAAFSETGFLVWKFTANFGWWIIDDIMDVEHCETSAQIWLGCLFVLSRNGIPKKIHLIYVSKSLLLFKTIAFDRSFVVKKIMTKFSKAKSLKVFMLTEKF